MGRKAKATENGLVELIVDKWDGGKNTIVYVTEEVNKILEEKGLHVTFSRESIRRVIKSHEEEIADTGTEVAEAMTMHLSTLIAKDLRTVDSLEFDDPEKLVSSASRIAETQLKLSQARMKAVKALDKAKQQLKDELSKEIQSDPELLSKLCSIIDKTEIK